MLAYGRGRWAVSQTTLTLESTHLLRFSLLVEIRTVTITVNVPRNLPRRAGQSEVSGVPALVFSSMFHANNRCTEKVSSIKELVSMAYIGSG